MTKEQSIAEARRRTFTWTYEIRDLGELVWACNQTKGSITIDWEAMLLELDQTAVPAYRAERDKVRAYFERVKNIEQGSLPKKIPLIVTHSALLPGQKVLGDFYRVRYPKFPSSFCVIPYELVVGGWPGFEKDPRERAAGAA